MAYFLGVMATDGCVYGDSLSIFVQAKDRKWLRKVLDVIDSSRKLSTRETAGRKYCGFYISQKGIAKALAKWKITERKSHTITFPSKIPDNIVHFFIRGCFDGDGSITFSLAKDRSLQRYNQSVKLTSGSKSFLEGVARVLNKKGIETSLKVEKRKLPRKDLYRLYVLTGSYEKFYNYLYKGGGKSLLRKKTLYAKMLRHRSKYVNGVQKRQRRIVKKLTEDYFEKHRDASGNIPVKKIASRLNIHHTTVYRRLRALNIPTSFD